VAGLHRWTTYGETSTRGLFAQRPALSRYHRRQPEFPRHGYLNLAPTSNFSNSKGGLFYPLYYYGSLPVRAYSMPTPVSGQSHRQGHGGSYFNATTANG